MPSGLKETVLVIEEFEAASTEPGCVELLLHDGNDNLGMKVFNIVSSPPGKKRKQPDECQSKVSGNGAND